MAINLSGGGFLAPPGSDNDMGVQMMMEGVNNMEVDAPLPPPINQPQVQFEENAPDLVEEVEDGEIFVPGQNLLAVPHDVGMDGMVPAAAAAAAVPPGGVVNEGAPAPWNLTDFFLNPSHFDPRAGLLHIAVNTEGDTALYIAAKAGHDEAVRALLGVPETQVNWQNDKGVTALSVAAHKGRIGIMQQLIAAHANVDLESNNGSTPLIQASHFGHAEAVEILVQAGATVDKPNNKGTTALMRASQEGKEEVVDVLIRAGADVCRRNNERMNALMLGSQRGHANLVKRLILHNAEIDGQTAQGSTALNLACKRGHTGVITVLLTAGAEIDVKDSRGRTAADTAARRQYVDILALLTPEKQMNLRQEDSRSRRTQLLEFLYRHQQLQPPRTSSTLPQAVVPSAMAASLAPPPPPRFAVDEKALEDSKSLSILTVTLGLTRPLFERILDFMPLPRLWEDTLVKLRRRCHINPHGATREAVQMIDEVFTDLLLVPTGKQVLHMQTINMTPELERKLTQEMGMPRQLCALVKEWSDVASVIMRLGKVGGVTFETPVAVQMVQLATEVVKWSRCYEASKEYNLDAAASNAFFSGNDMVADGNGGAPNQAAHNESESSESEMDI